MTTDKTAPDAKTEGPIEWTGPDGFRMRMRVYLADANNHGAEATASTLIAALQANPQLRAEVLDAMLPDGYWDMAEIARLRAAESELAAERARVRDMADEREELLTLVARHSAEMIQSVRIAKFMQDCLGKTAELCSARDQKPAATTEESPDPKPLLKAHERVEAYQCGWSAAMARRDSEHVTRADVLSLLLELVRAAEANRFEEQAPLLALVETLEKAKERSDG